MKTIKLGSDGPEVPAVGLGCMGMSEFYGASDTRESLAVLERASDLGCTFWDTADIYGPLRNEELLSTALSGRREKITLATKFGISRDNEGNWLGVNGRPEYVRSSCEGSLKRLKTDCIDIYYQHRMDPDVPVEETVGAMSDLVSEGKVRYLGLSEADAGTLERAHKVHPIAVLQTEYSLWSRDVEASILPTCQRLGIGFVAYSPLGRGFLSGAVSQRNELEDGDWRRGNPRFQDEAIQHNRLLSDKIQEIAAANSVTAAQVSLAWLLSRKPEVAMIPGTRRLNYLEQNWGAMELALPAVDIEDLDRFSKTFQPDGDRY